MTQHELQHERLPVASVWVDDWRHCGNAWEEWGEDGPRVVLPDHCLVVLAETTYGEIYAYDYRPDITPDEAERLVTLAGARGFLMADFWRFVRVAYGTAAYLDESEWMTPQQRAGEE